MYVCPTCKRSLEDGVCAACGFTVDLAEEVPTLDLAEEVPTFLSRSGIANRYRGIAQFYDSIYESRADVAWGGRGPEFITYVASLVGSMHPTRYLDIGCGQGRLLSAVSAPQKFGIDISHKAVETTRQRVTARLCRGIVEELPYPANYFDAVTGIGLLHHVLDRRAATLEVWRVLREGGSYILNLAIQPPLFERLMIKISEFIYPQFRLVSFWRWALAKYGRAARERLSERASPDRIVQPVYNRYTAVSVRRLFRRSGFSVRSLITKRRMPSAPLVDHRFRIYVLEKTTFRGARR